MAKATLLQRLLNNPSQTYSFPPQRDYHSTKEDLLKIATQLYVDPPLVASDVLSTCTLPVVSDDEQSYFTLQVEHREEESDDEFFTPRSSAYSTPTSPQTPTAIPSLKVTQPTPPTNHDDWNSVDPMEEDAWSDTAESAETHSIFSAALSSSTRATTPVNSDSGHSKRNSITAVTISSAASSQRSSKRSSSSHKLTEDWSKDVRWLVPQQTAIVSTPKPRRKKSSRTLSDASRSTKSRGKNRMSAVLEESEDDGSTTMSAVSHSNRKGEQQQNLRIPARSRSGSSHGHKSTRSGKSSTTSKYTTVSVPILEAAAPPSRGTTPYSTLTLARASAMPPQHAVYSSSARNSSFFASSANVLEKLKIEDSGKIDMTRDGMASTTMATIEVVKGSAQTIRGLGLGRSFSWKLKSKSERSQLSTPVHLLAAMPSPLGFCSRQPPPNYVPSTHVLVQVWGVALDGRDDVVVRKEKTGFIPGRSFVGRVVETGWEVSEDIIKKGEWVVGLIDVKKCGALAEFVVVDRHRLYRIAQPASVDVPRSPSTPTSSLTVEELSLLPLCGVFAYRAVKTFDPSATTTTPAHSSRAAKRVLILDGHEGTGALAAQMLSTKGWNVVIQVSPQTNASLEDIERRLETWGIEEICYGDALSVLSRLLERCEAENYVVDGVLDTIGGLDIWNASQKILRPSTSSTTQAVSPKYRMDFETPPQFTTLVGDDQARAIPTTQDHFKAGIRSLKRAVSAGCGYAWVSIGADIDGDGCDVRAALAGAVKWGECSDVRPHVSEGVLFENVPSVFANGSLAFKSGGTVVVKIVG